jgi:branched-chain amino acid transport system substrate-binding protein
MATGTSDGKSAKTRKKEGTLMLRCPYRGAYRGLAGRIARTAVLALALVAALASSGSAAAAQRAVKLAIVTYLSGPGAGPSGIPAKNAATLVIEAINNGTLFAPYHSKGLAGARIDSVVLDEAGSTTQVVENYRNLVQQRHVDAVVGYLNSGNCLAVAPVAEELKTLTVFTSCGTSRIFEDHSYNYVFRTRPVETIDGAGAARYLKTAYPNATTYAGINQNYAWGQDSWHDFVAAMKIINPHAKVSVALWPKIFAGQYSAEISTLLIDKPAVIHSSFWGGDLNALLTQAAARGLGKHSHLLLTLGEGDLYTHSKLIPDGTIIGAGGAWGVFAKKTRLNNWFRAAYEKRFGTPPIYPSYHVAQALVGLKAAYDKAAKKAGQFPTPEEVIKALTHLKFEGFGEEVDMALGEGHQAVTAIAYGTYRFDPKTHQPKMMKVVYFSAGCVNPPPGTKAEQWIEGGFQGAKCP